MNVLSIFFTLLIVVSALSYGQADNASSNIKLPPLAKWQVTESAVKIIFEDGREATLVIDVFEKLKASTKAIIVENTCFPEQVATDCRWDYELGAYALKLVWSKHTDPAKLKQVVTIKKKTEEKKIISNFDDVDFSETTIPAEGISKVNPILSCGTDSWIRNLPKAENQNYLIHSWALEFMASNQITSKNENQTLFQAHHVELKPLGNNRWEQITPESQSRISRLAALADPNTAYYKTETHSCSLQFRVEKSFLSLLPMAAAQPLSGTYAFRPGKTVSKRFRSQQIFYYMQSLVSERYTNIDDFKVE